MSDNPLAEWLRARERDHRGGHGGEPVQAPRGEADDGVARGTDPPGPAGPGPAGSTGTGPPGSAGAGPAGTAGAAPPEALRPPRAPWDDEDEEEPARPRRRLVVFAVAVVPWLVAGVAVTAALHPTVIRADGSRLDGETPPSGAEADDAAEAAPPREANATDAADEAEDAERQRSLASAVPPRQAAAAVLAVRTAVPTTAGESGEDEPRRRRYVDLAVAEGVTPVGDVAVVTVAATVLEGTAEHWQRARPARFGVAVRDTEDGPVAVGRPWPLPGPPSADEELGWQDTEADVQPVEAALAAAGYTRVRDVTLSRSDAALGVLRAECRAVAPGEASPRRHAVWVSDEATPVVLGTPRAGGPDHEPAS